MDKNKTTRHETPAVQSESPLTADLNKLCHEIFSLHVQVDDTTKSLSVLKNQFQTKCNQLLGLIRTDQHVFSLSNGFVVFVNADVPTVQVFREFNYIRFPGASS